MPITINGDGTITGLSAGGLPNNSVQTADIADNQITGAKIQLGSDAAGDIMYYNGTDYVRLGKGTNGHYLKQGTSNAPEWAAVATGSDKIEEGNTSAEVVDTGTDGHFKVTTEGSERIRVLSGGNALYGATSATDSASIIEAHGGNMSRPLLTKTATTNSNYSLMCQNDNGIVGSISTAGSGTAFNTSSDYRLKENVVNLTGGISRLKTLKPKRFNFKADASTTLDGFLDHEVTAVPEAIIGVKDAVDSDDKINPQGLDHSRLVPLLTAALQEAITKIETLETKVAALEAG